MTNTPPPQAGLRARLYYAWHGREQAPVAANPSADAPKDSRFSTRQKVAAGLAGAVAGFLVCDSYFGVNANMNPYGLGVPAQDLKSACGAVDPRTKQAVPVSLHAKWSAYSGDNPMPDTLQKEVSHGFSDGEIFMDRGYNFPHASITLEVTLTCHLVGGSLVYKGSTPSTTEGDIFLRKQWF